MKNKQIISVVLLAGMLAACGSKHEKDFVRGCASTGADEDVCSCAFDHVAEVYTDDDFDRMQRTMEFPDSYKHVMINAMLACRDE